MGTDKRQRQKDGRASRVAAAEAAKKKADQRALVLRVLMIAAVLVVVVGVLWVFAGNDEGDDTATPATTVDPNSTTPSMSTPPTLASVAGQPCVAPTSPPAEGEPVVPVVEGPPPTELVIEDLVVGTGEEVPDDPTTTVTVNYVGVACSTGATFDSSFARGEPISFSLDGVISGWTEGVPGMKVGGRRLLGIPSEMAYGPAGQGDIAPDETLWFVIDLVAIGDQTATTETTVPPDTEGTGASTTTVAGGDTLETTGTTR